MGCSTCGGGGINRTPAVHSPQQKVNLTEKIHDCAFSGGLLRVWYNILKCVKDNNKLSKIGLTAYEANVHLGNIQSAINIPDNYCYFATQLTDYQTNILPRIIEHVPTCI